MAIEDIRQKYAGSQTAANLASQRKALERTFSDISACRQTDVPLYQTAKAFYDDALAVFDAASLSDTEKQALLYPIYDGFYGFLAQLPWKKRNPCKVDKHIKAMKSCLKSGQRQSASIRYWVDFARYAGPLFVAFILLEILFLDLLGTAPVWQVVLAFLGFAAAFAGYFVVTYNLEGQRLFGTLQKWIWFRAGPKEHSRPLDLLQGAKMAIPLLVALGGALIKLYIK